MGKVRWHLMMSLDAGPRRGRALVGGRPKVLLGSSDSEA
jgi:hypothetical protein